MEDLPPGVRLGPDSVEIPLDPHEGLLTALKIRGWIEWKYGILLGRVEFCRENAPNPQPVQTISKFPELFGGEN